MDHCKTFAVFQTMTSVSTGRSIDHAKLWLICALMCQGSFYWKTSLQILRTIWTPDYSVWTALQKMQYRNEISDTERLKRVLIDCWSLR